MSDELELPYTAISNDQLGETVTETAECPKCHEQHPLRYGTSGGVEYRGIGFVRCDTQTFLASIDGRQVKNSLGPPQGNKDLKQKQSPMVANAILGDDTGLCA